MPRLKPGQVLLEGTWLQQKDENLRKAEAVAHINKENRQQAKRVFNERITDRNLIIIAIKNTSVEDLLITNFDFIPEELRDNNSIIHTALMKLGYELFKNYVSKFISPEKLNDRDFMLNMANSHGSKTIEYASVELQNDESFVQEAKSLAEKVDSSRTAKSYGTKRSGRNDIFERVR